MSGMLRFYRPGHEIVEATFGDGMHEGKITFEKIGDDGKSRFAAKVGEEEFTLARSVMEALKTYYSQPRQNTIT